MVAILGVVVWDFEVGDVWGESQIWQFVAASEGFWGKSNWLKLNKYTSSC